MKPEHPSAIVLLGAFSSGKSSLVNALIGKKLLPTGLTPTTAAPALLRFGAAARIAVCRPGDNTPVSQAIDRPTADAMAEASAAQGWLEIDEPALARWPEVELVDTPGWGSGDAAHEERSDGWLRRLASQYPAGNIVLLYCLAADEGTVKDAALHWLARPELAAATLWLALTKSDKRNDQENAQILARAADMLRERAHCQIARTMTLSARNGTLAPLTAALDELCAARNEARKPKIDKARLAEAIERFLKRLQDLRVRDLLSDVADALESRLDEAIDDYFSFVPLSSAASRAGMLLDRVRSEYPTVLRTVLDSNLPKPDAAILADLQALGLQAPQWVIMNDGQRTIRHLFREWQEKIARAARPGIFGSDDPEKVGARMREAAQDLARTILSAFKGCTHEAASEALHNYAQEWQRLRRLLDAQTPANR